MEQWEVEYREDLNKKLKDGSYQIGNSGDRMILHTGKSGYIEYLVSIRKEAKKVINKINVLANKDPETLVYGKITTEKWDEIIKKLYSE